MLCPGNPGRVQLGFGEYDGVSFGEYDGVSFGEYDGVSFVKKSRRE